jgi:heavy metal sensor kinase
VILRPRHVRTRLTLWYVGVLSAVLALYAAFTLVFLYLSLREGLDRGLDAEFERVEDILTEASDGSIRMGGHDEGESLVEVWSPDGGLLFRSPQLEGQALGDAGSAGSGRGFTSITTPSGRPLRVLSHRHRLGQREVFMRVAISEEPLRHEWRELGVGLLVGLPLAIAIAGLGGHWLATRALAPIDDMARHAERLTADTLGERLPVENSEDELAHLARVFNLALARIEESFARLRRFTADVSHELRTPLTAIRSVGEVGLAERRNENEYRETIGSILEEADRLTVMVDTLLSLSRADAGEVKLDLKPVDLVALAGDVAAHLAVLAEEKAQRLDVEAAGPAVVAADRLVLRQALVNVVDNAIKYSPPGSRVRVVVRENGAASRIEVVDEGPGIAPEHRERIFERFYRVDAARSRERGGAGLGLSLAKWAMTAHGGRIEVESADGRGSTFRLSFPRAGTPGVPPAR